MLPAGFIIFQTLLEILIYIAHIEEYVFSENIKLEFFGILWLIQYFYCFWSFSTSSFMDPGYLSSSWINEVKNDPNFKDELAENGEKNFCETCFLPRPLRCHHCKECGNTFKGLGKKVVCPSCQSDNVECVE